MQPGCTVHRMETDSQFRCMLMHTCIKKCTHCNVKEPKGCTISLQLWKELNFGEVASMAAVCGMGRQKVHGRGHTVRKSTMQCHVLDALGTQ